MYKISTGERAFSIYKSSLRQHSLATNTLSHEDEFWCLSDFVATLKFRRIIESSFRVVILFAYLCTFSLTLNHTSLAAEDINQEEFNIIDELVVNNRNTFKTVIHENEEEGISEMRKLIASSQIEESWAFLPHQEKWIEIGHNEETEKKIDKRYITKAMLDIQLLDELMSENNSMALYHFHPSYSLSLEDKIRKQKEDGLPMNDKEIEREKIRLLIKSAYPSRSDLLNMIGNTTEFFERNSDGDITFKICSHYGITEYHLTDEGITYLRADNSIKQILRITGISSSANIDVNVMGEILERNPMETKDPLKRIKMSPKQKRKSLSRYTIIGPLARIRKAIESMNDEHVRVIFTPYR